VAGLWRQLWYDELFGGVRHCSESVRLDVDRSDSRTPFLQDVGNARPSGKAVKPYRIIDQDSVAHGFVRCPLRQQIEQKRVVGLFIDCL
jgi:hypothetical protein